VNFNLGEALRTKQWYFLTAILALNTTAGIALVSQAADAARDIAEVSAGTAAGLVAVLALFNGAGRIFWAGLSDKIGRMMAFVGMLGLQAVCFLLLPRLSAFAVFAVLAAIIYLCYGGGFGTMPATAADFFGTMHAGAIYGAMIVAWSIGGVVGPLLTSLLYEANNESYDVPFTVIGIIAAIALVLPFLTKAPRPTKAGDIVDVRDGTRARSRG
jgi:OFA family oxalate/formate antiporter-like MFS transporter